ncbi:MAG: patatin-like phospholipase family protein [Deltaproteobacteria bacterium]|nr:patatin-like phospholipase family protein [Deltaproteobacteria bacterium]
MRATRLGIGALALVAACTTTPAKKDQAATQPTLPGSAPATQAALPPKQVDPPKIALVLGGGGARGFAHVGVLRVLVQEKVPIDLIVGTSVGSLIGALYAANPDVFELEWKAFEIDKDDLFDYSFFSAKAGLVKGEAIKEFVRKNVRWPLIEQFPVRYIAVATDLNNGERVEFKSGPIVDAVRASVAIPGVFSPTRVGDRLLVDGGVVANIAVDTAKANGADIVIASNISQKVVDYQVDDMLSTILQSITIMMSEAAESQLQHADVVVTPDIGDVGTLDFSQKKRCMQAGIEAAKAQVANVKQAIARYYVERGGVPPAP